MQSSSDNLKRVTGQVSIFINTDESPAETLKYDPSTEKDLDRSKFGVAVGNIGSGKSFGELALINKDCIRNASIIADEECDLIEINRELYNRSLKSFQEAELKERSDFVYSCNLFTKWSQLHKKQAAMSIIRETFDFDQNIVTQGAPLNGLIFIRSGTAKVTMNTIHHRHQYPNLGLANPVEQLDAIVNSDDCTSMDDVNSSLCSRISKVSSTETIDSQFKKTGQTHNWNSFKAKLGLKSVRRLGYTYLSKINELKKIETAIYGAGEIIGLFEYGLELPTYAETVVCSDKCEAFILDAKNFERLAYSRKNPGTQRLLRAIAEKNILQRMCKYLDANIPLIYTIANQITASREEEERKRRKSDVYLQRELKLISLSGSIKSLLVKQKTKHESDKMLEKMKKMNQPKTLLGMVWMMAGAKHEEEDALEHDSIGDSITGSKKMMITDAKDWETSSEHLSDLEDRIRYWFENVDQILANEAAESIETGTSATEFMAKSIMSYKRNVSKEQHNIIKLRRFIEEEIDSSQIVPGKRIYIRPHKDRLVSESSSQRLVKDTEASYDLKCDSSRSHSGTNLKPTFLTTLLASPAKEEPVRGFQTAQFDDVQRKQSKKASKKPGAIKMKRTYTVAEYQELRQELRRREIQMTHFKTSLST